MTQAVLGDWRTAPVAEPLRATLGLLQKVTLTPEEIEADDLERVRAADVRDEAIVDALYVCALFNLIDRIADALEFQVESKEFFAGLAPRLLKRGYK